MWAVYTDDIDFTRDAEYSLAFEQATNTIVAFVKKGEEQRKYSTRDYLKIILTRYNLIIDDHIEDRSEAGIWSRITAASNAKVTLLRNISGIRHYEIIHNIPDENRTDFSDMLEHTVAVIERIELDKDWLKYSYEVTKLRDETRKYRIAIIIGTFLIAAVTLSVTIFNGNYKSKVNLPEQPSEQSSGWPPNKDTAKQIQFWIRPAPLTGR